jgi:mono/diheme cytochrome c family protein
MRNKSIGALTLCMLALLGVTLLTRNSQVQASHALQEASAKTNADKLPAAATSKVDFTHDVQPILADHCYVCHGPTQQMVGLRLDEKQSAFRVGQAGPLILPGKSGESQLIVRVTSSKEGFRMPFSGPPLNQQQIATLRAWIDQGAEWSETSAAAPGLSAYSAIMTEDPLV